MTEMPVASTAPQPAAMAPPPPRDNVLWGDDWPSVAAEWQLEPSVTHVNHGSFGAVPAPVLEEQRSWRIRMESNPVRFFSRDVRPALQTAREEVAAFLGADGTDDVAFVPNATTGVSTVLASAGLRNGDEILVTDHAYGAVRIAAERFGSAAGARVTVASVPLDCSDDELVERVLARVGARTRLAIIDHVTSATARRLPVERLVPALQERGVAVCVDAAHAPGMLPVRLDSLAPDYWTGNLHKWACAPRGTAALYVAPRHRTRLRPLVASWHDDAGFPTAFDMTGTSDVTAWLAAPTAIRTLGRLGWDRVRQHNGELARVGQRTVAEAVGRLAGNDPIAGLVDDVRIPMRLVRLPEGLATDPETAGALQRRIAEELAVEVAVNAWGGIGLLRLSAQVYNSPADYVTLAERLPRVLRSAAGRG